MRNGKILGWAWGAGFVDGIGQGMERASQPAVGLGATAAYGAGDVLKMGIGGGASKAAQTLSDYYIKRAEQYHPVIPIGAGNEVTVVFQDGFQLKTVEEMALERTQSRAEEDNPESPVPVPPSAESHLNGFNTDQMLKQLGKPGLQRLLLIIVDSVRVKGNEVVWFRQCRPKILFQLSIGQKSRYVLIISV